MKTALLVVACLIVTAQPCAAEWFGDIYVGGSFTDSHDVKVNDKGAGLATYHAVDFDTTLSYGLRFGRFLDSVPWVGFGLDYFGYSPRISTQTVTANGCIIPQGGCGTNRVGFGSYDLGVSAVSLDLFLRLPLLATQDAPWGRIQPYLVGGAPAFISTLTPRHTHLFRNNDGDTDFSFGYKGGAGLAVSVYKNLMVFGEYRFTHVSPDFEIRDSSAAKAIFKPDLDTHSALIGLSARW